jgi:hypothetical protein
MPAGEGRGCGPLANPLATSLARSLVGKNPAETHKTRPCGGRLGQLASPARVPLPAG